MLPKPTECTVYRTSLEISYHYLQLDVHSLTKKTLFCLYFALQEDMKQAQGVSSFLTNVLNYHTTIPSATEVETKKKKVTNVGTRPSGLFIFYLGTVCLLASRGESF